MKETNIRNNAKMVESRPLLLNTSLPLQSPTVQHKTVCDVRVILTAACAGVWSCGGHVAEEQEMPYLITITRTSGRLCLLLLCSPVVYI